MKILSDLDPQKVICAAFTGTTCMTLFSYLVSEKQKENFKEPELLAELLYRLVPELTKKYSLVAGWNIHYSVGLVFAVFYAKAWQAKKQKATIKSGLLFGGLSGLLAILVWKSAFKLHPNPPKIEFKNYAGHLLLAHFVFGVFASSGFNMKRLNH